MKEKSALSKELTFFIFLLEQCAAEKKTTATKMLEEWDAAGISNRIYSLYEQYHSEALENAFEEIDEMLRECRK